MPRFQLVFALLLAALLVGCGFEPMYARNGSGVSDSLAEIAIGPITNPEPAGFLVQDAIERRLTPNGAARAPAYQLSVNLVETRQALGIQIDSSVTRYNYTLRADYNLFTAVRPESIHTGTASSTASFNVVNSQFATLAAERDAQEKAAEQLAAEIEAQIAIFLSDLDRTPDTAQSVTPNGVVEVPAGEQR